MAPSRQDLLRKLASVNRRFAGSIWYRLMRTALFFALAAAILLGLSRLNILYVEKIELEPSDGEFVNVTDDAVRDAANQYIGKRLFSVSPDEVAKTIEQALPFVKTASVSKEIPDTLVVRIVERVPSLVVRSGTISVLVSGTGLIAQDTDVLVDTDQVVIDTCEKHPDVCRELPLAAMTGLPDVLTSGDRLSTTDIEGLNALARLLSEEKIEVAGFAVPVERTAVALLENNTRVIFSLSKAIDEQVELYLYTTETLSIAGTKYQELDFRYDRPVMRVDKYTDWMTE